MALKFGLSNWQKYQPRNDDNAPIVLCFGDSWFWYPVPGIGSLSNRLLEFGRYQAIDIAAIGKVGMEIASPGKNVLSELTTFLQWESKTIDMIAISGGGNDFAGADDLDPLLQQGKAGDAISWFKDQETEALFDRIATGYERIIYLRDTFCPTVPIVTHCYDYAQPTGKGFLWFSPWIKPSLEKIGMPPALHAEAIAYIIDQLATVQQSLAGPLYHFLDTRGLLALEDWSNELHPTGEGFNKIARPFYPVFEKYFPDWVRKPKWF
ncbi:MAG: hypothetical protein Q7T62_14800 [Undibacterium sp.]|jgi:hypothetical protein|nr:hypothetical protein [Undibacterium sp.]MDO8702264.1 hypothetical protein [Undibacterium sp.]